MEVPEKSILKIHIIVSHSKAVKYLTRKNRNSKEMEFILKIMKDGNPWKEFKTSPQSSVKIELGKVLDKTQIVIVPVYRITEHGITLEGEPSPPISINVIPDSLPTLSIRKPSSREVEDPRGILSYQIEAEDDRMVSQIFLEYAKNEATASENLERENLKIKPAPAVIIEGNWTPPFALFPGQSVKVRFGVRDNCPWHPAVLSDWYILKTPPISSYYRDIAKGIEEAGSSLQKNYQELKSSREELHKNQIYGNTRNWESKQKARELSQKIKDTKKVLKQASRKIEELKKRAQKLSPEEALEVLENLAKLQRIMKELNLNIENIDFEKIQKNPQQTEQNLKDILEKLKRTVALLEKLSREMLLKEFIKRIEELKEQQREANTFYREGKIPENQQEIAQNERRLSHEIKSASRDYPEIQNLMEQAANLTEEASSLSMQQNLKSAEESMEKLIEAQTKLERALKEEFQQQNQKVLSAIKELIKFSIAAAMHVREYREKLYALSFTEKQNYAIALEKSYALSKNYMEVLLENLFFVPHTLTGTYYEGFRLARRLRESLTSSPQQLENIYGYKKVSIEQMLAQNYTNLNRLSYELMKFFEQLQKGGMEQNYKTAMKSIQKALKGQQKLSQELENAMQKMGKNEIPTPTLQRMAKEQEELRKLLEEALKTIKSRELESAQGAMKGAEKKLREGKAEEALKNQKKAEQNLLEFEKSDIVKGKSRKREAQKTRKDLYSKNTKTRQIFQKKESTSRFVPSTIPPRLRKLIVEFLQEENQ